MVIVGKTPVPQVGRQKRAMPTIIAQNIRGVSPLVAPTKPALSRWRAVWTKQVTVLSPRTYHHFLRLNNRRRGQDPMDLAAAGYPSHSLDLDMLRQTGDHDKIKEVDLWCDQHLGQHAWLRFRWSNTWWFSRPVDATLFCLTWC